MKYIPPLNFPYPVFSTNPVSIQSCDGQLNLCRSQCLQPSNVGKDSYHVLTPVDVAYATVCYCRTLYTPYYVYSAYPLGYTFWYWLSYTFATRFEYSSCYQVEPLVEQTNESTSFI